MSNVKKLLNLNLARFRLKTATLGLRTTAAGRKFLDAEIFFLSRYKCQVIRNIKTRHRHCIELQ